MNAIARRAFSSRSAIRAPPAPNSSTLPLASAAPRSTIRAGRVAMLPKSSEPSSVTGPVSYASTTATSSEAQDILPQVGSVSIPGEGLKVSRIGESS